MATNDGYNFMNCVGTQGLYESLSIEIIKIYGQDVHYLPRTLVNVDLLFGEDALSIFSTAATIEAYVKSVDGFEGEGDFLAKFNLEIRDSITFVIARKRFDQIRTEKLLYENGWTIEQEGLGGLSRQYLSENHETDVLELEDANGDNYSITANRPAEGDYIYFPMVRKLFEIKYVEHEDLFYQAGRLRTYELRCDLVSYSSERLDTGVVAIDEIEDRYTTDLRLNELLSEDGNIITLESGTGHIVKEYRIEDNQPTANNELINAEGHVYIDFSEINPFLPASSTY